MDLGRVPAAVNAALAVHFPPELGVDIIAEPGRCVVLICCCDIRCPAEHCHAVTPPCHLICFRQAQVRGVVGCFCRFFAEACATLVCQVFGRRQRDVPPVTVAAPALGLAVAAPLVVPPSVFDYYITDGLYGSFNCIMYDHAQPTSRPLRCPTLPSLLPGKDATAGEGGAAFPSTVFGPSCDGLDTVFQVNGCSSVATVALIEDCLL